MADGKSLVLGSLSTPSASSSGSGADRIVSRYNSRYFLIRQGLFVYVLDQTFLDEYKNELADITGTVLIAPITHAQHLPVFLKVLEELIDYSIYYNQSAIGNISVITENKEWYDAILELVTRKRMYIEDLGEWYPEPEKFVFYQNIVVGTFCVQWDDNRFVYGEVQFPRSVEYEPWEIPEPKEGDYEGPDLGESGGEGGSEGEEGPAKNWHLVDLTESRIKEIFKDDLAKGYIFEIVPPAAGEAAKMHKIYTPSAAFPGSEVESVIITNGRFDGTRGSSHYVTATDPEGIGYINRVFVRCNIKFLMKRTFSMSSGAGAMAMNVGIGEKFERLTVSYNLNSFDSVILDSGVKEDDNWPE